MGDKSNPAIGFDTAAWYWTVYKGYAHLNALADSVNPKNAGSITTTITKISVAVNGGTTGLTGPDGRIAHYQKALAVLRLG